MVKFEGFPLLMVFCLGWCHIMTAVMNSMKCPVASEYPFLVGFRTAALERQWSDLQTFKIRGSI